MDVYMLDITADPLTWIKLSGLDDSYQTVTTSKSPPLTTTTYAIAATEEPLARLFIHTQSDFAFAPLPQV
jgi:hypothetical protein